MPEHLSRVSFTTYSISSRRGRMSDADSWFPRMSRCVQANQRGGGGGGGGVLENLD